MSEPSDSNTGRAVSKAAGAAVLVSVIAGAVFYFWNDNRVRQEISDAATTIRSLSREPAMRLEALGRAELMLTRFSRRPASDLAELQSLAGELRTACTAQDCLAQIAGIKALGEKADFNADSMRALQALREKQGGQPGFPESDFAKTRDELESVGLRLKKQEALQQIDAARRWAMHPHQLDAVQQLTERMIKENEVNAAFPQEEARRLAEHLNRQVARRKDYEALLTSASASLESDPAQTEILLTRAETMAKGDAQSLEPDFSTGIVPTIEQRRKQAKFFQEHLARREEKALRRQSSYADALRELERHKDGSRELPREWSAERKSRVQNFKAKNIFQSADFSETIDKAAAARDAFQKKSFLDADRLFTAASLSIQGLEARCNEVERVFGALFSAEQTYAETLKYLRENEKNALKDAEQVLKDASAALDANDLPKAEAALRPLNARLEEASAKVLSGRKEAMARANTLMKEGETAREEKRFFLAIAKYAEAAQIYKEQGDSGGRAFATFWQGWSSMPNRNSSGSWSGAQELLEQSLKLLDASANRKDRAHILIHLAVCMKPDENPAGDWRRASERYAEAARIFGEEGDAKSQAVQLFNQGYCLSQGEWARVTPAAAAIFKQAGAQARSAGDEANAKEFETWAADYQGAVVIQNSYKQPIICEVRWKGFNEEWSEWKNAKLEATTSILLKSIAPLKCEVRFDSVGGDDAVTLKSYNLQFTSIKRGTAPSFDNVVNVYVFSYITPTLLDLKKQ